MKCPICDNPMIHAFDARIMGKHPASYARCPECELIKPGNPVWLEESYSKAIAATDVGLVSRNLRNRELLGPILKRLHPASGRILDVGGGYGLLCRLMRDWGWDCHTMDAYCENLFAASFEPSDSFEAPTLLAFEVFEHIDDPLAFVREKTSRFKAETFVFSTLTHGWQVPPLDWWYYTFETGQHISLYTRKSLARLAREIGWHYLPVSDEMHVFTQSEPDGLTKLLLPRKHRILSRIFRSFSNFRASKRSLLAADYQMIKAKVIQSQGCPRS